MFDDEGIVVSLWVEMGMGSASSSLSRTMGLSASPGLGVSSPDNKSIISLGLTARCVRVA